MVESAERQEQRQLENDFARNYVHSCLSITIRNQFYSEEEYVRQRQNSKKYFLHFAVVFYVL